MFAHALLTLPFSPALTILLITSGALLIFVELNRPGLILPGCLGLLMLLLATDSLLRSATPRLPLLCLAVATALALLDTRRPGTTIQILLLVALTACFFSIVSHQPIALKVFALSSATALSVLTHFLATMAARARMNKTGSSAHPSVPETF